MLGSWRSELAASCRENGVPFITIFEQPEHRARGWLSLSAIQAERVYSRKLHRLGLQMTPSLILLDAESKVSSIYQGALSFPEEASVLQSVQAGRDLGSYHAGSGLPALISEVQLDELLKSRSDELQLVDIRHRQEFSQAHHPAALNIPGDELPIRGRIELDASRLTVVDCWKIPYHLCNRAARRFAVWGFEEITVADRGGAPCPSCKPEP